MSGTLIDCPVHGILTSNLISVEGEGTATSINTTHTCPICGRVSKVINGTYSRDPRTGGMKAVLLPTPAQRERLLTAARWAESELKKPDADQTIVVEKLRDTVKKEAPAFLSILDSTFKRAISPQGQGVAAWVAIVIALIAMFNSSQQASMDQEQIVEIIERVEREHVRLQSENDAPAPEPRTPHPGQTPEQVEPTNEVG